MGVKNNKFNIRSSWFDSYVSGKSKVYNTAQLGSANNETGSQASGGTKIVDSGEQYNVFLSDGTDTSHTFTVTNAPPTGFNCEVLIVAGGGGNSPGYYGGGSGGGGVVHGATIPVSISGGPTANGVYPITVGTGGTDAANVPGLPGTAIQYAGGRGGNSVFSGVTAIGGGAGAVGANASPSADYNPSDRVSGGSAGGGHGYVPGTPAQAKQPQPVPGDYTAYGNIGGNGGNASYWTGGGGGGAGGAGELAQTPGQFFGGTGGVGQPFPNFPAPIIAPAIPEEPVAAVPWVVDNAQPASPQTLRVAWTAAVGPTGLFGGGGGGANYYTYPYPGTPAGTPKGGTGGGGDGGGGNPTPGQKARDAIHGTGGGAGGGNYGEPKTSTNQGGGRGIVIVKFTKGA